MTSSSTASSRTIRCRRLYSFFFFNDSATTEIYTLSLHNALPIWCGSSGAAASRVYGAGAGKGKAVSDGPPRTAARQRGETSRIPGEAAGATRDGRRCVAENALQDGGRLGVGSGQCVARGYRDGERRCHRRTGDIRERDRAGEGSISRVHARHCGLAGHHKAGAAQGGSASQG